MASATVEAGKPAMDHEELARRLQACDEDAFRDFARAFAVIFRSYFIWQGLPAFEAEDLAATCMTEIPLKVSRYRVQETGGFRAWVFALMRNEANTWWRRQRAIREPLPEDVAFEPPVDVAVDVPRVEAVHEALAQLSDADRQIIELRDLGEERDYEEIGRVLGISTTNARVRHHRALRRLTAILTQDARVRRRS